MKTLLIAFALYISLPALGASPKTIQSVSADLDGDGKPDTVSELDIGAKKNVLRVQLSKSSKTLSYANILPHWKEAGNEGYCNDDRESEILVDKKEREYGPTTVSIVRNKGAFDGCETSYTLYQSRMKIYVENDQVQIASYADGSTDHGHHNNHDVKSAKFDFLDDFEVSVEHMTGYYSFTTRSLRQSFPQRERACKASLEDFNKTGALPKCATELEAELWANLWPKGERSDN
jgi:hypothetical protein